MKKLLRTPKRKSPALALTIAFTFALTLSLGVSLAYPKSACADECTISPVVINGQVKLWCQRCCNEAGACQMFCV
jgi:hypothetical protein